LFRVSNNTDKYGLPSVGYQGQNDYDFVNLVYFLKLFVFPYFRYKFKLCVSAIVFALANGAETFQITCRKHSGLVFESM